MLNSAPVKPATVRLAGFSRWTAGIQPVAETARLSETWADHVPEMDDAPTFDPLIDNEVDATAMPPADLAFIRKPTRRLMVDWQADPRAFKHLRKLPKLNESLHTIISATYSMWEIIPALLAHRRSPLLDLTITTLSYGKKNAEELLELIDARRVRRCTLVVSHFFKAQNQGLYDSLVPELLKRRGHRVLACRNHSKLLLCRFADGTHYVCEGSANLRSNSNLEQLTLTNCPRLYRFHRRWVDALFRSRGKAAA